MFHQTRFYIDHTGAVARHWWIFAALGAGFVLVSVLGVICAQMVERIVAGCLIYSGHLLLGIAWKLWRIKRFYRHWLP